MLPASFIHPFFFAGLLSASNLHVVPRHFSFAVFAPAPSVLLRFVCPWSLVVFPPSLVLPPLCMCSPCPVSSHLLPFRSSSFVVSPLPFFPRPLPLRFSWFVLCPLSFAVRPSSCALRPDPFVSGSVQVIGAGDCAAERGFARRRDELKAEIAQRGDLSLTYPAQVGMPFLFVCWL